jgi:hypothetical protein
VQNDRVITGTLLIAAGIILAIFLVSSLRVPGPETGENGIAVTVPATPAPEAGITAIPFERFPPRGYYWTMIDPVPDIRFGSAGNVTIRGRTNVPAGEILRVECIAHSMHPSPMEYYPDLQFSATADVVNGEGGINGWSVEIPRGNFMKPDIFQILVVNQSGYSIGGSSVNVTPAG